MRIYSGLKIENFFSQKEEFKNIYHWLSRSGEYKCIEIELLYYSRTLFEVEIDIRPINVDHRGFSFEIGLFGYSIAVNFYDTRHMD